MTGESLVLLTVCCAVVTHAPDGVVHDGLLDRVATRVPALQDTAIADIGTDIANTAKTQQNNAKSIFFMIKAFLPLDIYIHM